MNEFKMDNFGALRFWKFKADSYYIEVLDTLPEYPLEAKAFTPKGKFLAKIPLDFSFLDVRPHQAYIIKTVEAIPVVAAHISKNNLKPLKT
jgi:hypothetical protein